MTAGSSTVSASEIAARWSSPPDHVDDEARPATPEAETGTWSEKVYAALPLFLVGGACLAVAIDFYYSGTTTQFLGNSSVRLSPWTLFLALALTGIASGTLTLFVEDETPAPTPSETFLTQPGASTPVPAWDESTIVPEKPTLVRPRTWEQYPWAPSEPVLESGPPDFILSQIDEIAASLRKKPPPSGSP